MYPEFQNKVAISTGAASGMGLLFAQNFAQYGGHVVMCDVNEPVLMEKVAEINAKDGGRAVGVLCDVRDYAQVCAARDQAVEAFGSLAGYSRIVCVADPRCPLDEKSIVWFGVSTDEPHNYIVTRKADSKNGILYALQEVKVRV